MTAVVTARCRPTALPRRIRRSISTARALDAAIERATADPYRLLPRAVVMAATASAPCIYSGRGGYARLPSRPTPADELARSGEPITDRSIFELYSCTKLVAAVATLQLVEQGRIGLDDDASRYVPELGEVKLFKGFDAEGELVLEENRVPITLRMLLTHTAGTVDASKLLRGLPHAHMLRCRVRVLHAQPMRDSDRCQARHSSDALLLCDGKGEAEPLPFAIKEDISSQTLLTPLVVSCPQRWLTDMPLLV